MIMNYDVHGEKLHEYHVHITAAYHQIFLGELMKFIIFGFLEKAQLAINFCLKVACFLVVTLWM